MYGPDDLPTGLACGARCPSCLAPLIAKNRQFSRRLRTTHFSHAHGTGCAAGAETAVHRMAKQVLLESGSLELPEWGEERILWADDGSRHVVRHQAPAECRTYTCAQAEVPYDGFRPDIVLTGEFGATRELLVEIRVAHAVDEIKKGRLKAQSRFAIEITLESLSLDANHFRDAVLRDAPREWLSHPAHEAALAAEQAAIARTITHLNVRHSRDLALAEGGETKVIAALDAETRTRVRDLLARRAAEEKMLAEVRERSRVKLEEVGWVLRADHATRGSKIAEQHRHLAQSHTQAKQCQECCWLSPPTDATCQECGGTNFQDWPLTARRLQEMPQRLKCHPGFTGIRKNAVRARATSASAALAQHSSSADAQMRLPF
jgi:hypothetical protein